MNLLRKLTYATLQVCPCILPRFEPPVIYLCGNDFVEPYFMMRLFEEDALGCRAVLKGDRAR
jgi:hypothetical protein